MADPQDGLRRSAAYSRFLVGRRVDVRVQAKVDLAGRRSGRDFSDAKWEFEFRAYVEPVETGQVFVLQLPMTKVVGTALAGDTGIAEVPVVFGWSALGELYCEIVVIDTATPDATTTSGKAEYLVDAPWKATVYASAGKP